jgi:hypothetical protein
MCPASRLWNIPSARFSKKLVCSAPFSISSIHGSGFLSCRNRLEVQLLQAAVADIADVIFHFLRRQAFDRALFEREVDELVFETDNRAAAIGDFALQVLIPDILVFVE